MTKKTYNTWGGSREGSGRKKEGITVNSSLTVRGTKQQISDIKALAQKSGLSISQYCIKELLEN